MKGKRRWFATLRVEKRCGLMHYVAEFTDGQLRASLYGSVNPPHGLAISIETGSLGSRN